MNVNDVRAGAANLPWHRGTDRRARNLELDTKTMNLDTVYKSIHIAAPIARDKHLHLVRFLQSVAQSLQVSLNTADAWRIVLADLYYF